MASGVAELNNEGCEARDALGQLPGCTHGAVTRS